MGYSLGMVKIEAFVNRCFMHQFVTLTNVRMYVCMYIYIYVCMHVCMCVCMYCMGVYMPISPKGQSEPDEYHEK